jgi:hypothetical protein
LGGEREGVKWVVREGVGAGGKNKKKFKNKNFECRIVCIVKYHFQVREKHETSVK